VSEANHNLNRLLDKPGLYYIENICLGYDGQIRRVGDRGSSASQKMIFEIDFLGKKICQRQKILFFQRRYSLPRESVYSRSHAPRWNVS